MDGILLNKMLKKVSVLIIMFVMFLSAVMVTANNQSLEFILASEEDIQHSQQINVFDPDWIHFDDGTNVNSIGLINGGTFESAIRITPTELVEYDGYELTIVRWHHGYTSSPSHSGTIKIYDEGTSTSPGGLITSESFNVPSAGWFEIPLSNPVSIDVSKDIWVSIRITHAAGEYPAGVGPGPVVAGKGGWISNDGVTWYQLGIDIPDLNYNWNIWAKVEIPSEPPETPQRPSGPTEGIVGYSYVFSTSTDDPEGEQVSYMWDWNDGTPTEWTEYYDSGATVYTNHTWTEIGIYNITVKAKDTNGEESAWSDPKMIIIVDTAILEIENITGDLFKVKVVVKNFGGLAATRVSWSITLDGGIILFGKETTGNILSLSAGDEKTISSGLIFGFGKTMITVSAEIPESSATKDQKAFVFLFFIRMINV
jgi:hypothetical protein